VAPHAEISTHAGGRQSEEASHDAGAIGKSGAHVTFDPIPYLRVHTAQLQQLFQNLVGDGIKYRRSDAAPLVHVAARRQDGN
jgi:light-regulated signal transduction histidine kinase (bacteriophytochrome)